MLATRRTWALIAGLIASWSAGAAAQPPVPYAASPDPLYYSLWNFRSVYFVRGRDTVWTRQRKFEVQTQQWTEDANAMHVVIWHLCVDALRCALNESFFVSPAGRVEAVNGKPVSADSAVTHQFLMPLPNQKLKPGVTWDDSSRVSTPGVGGGTAYALRVTYRVSRLFDTLGTRVAEVLTTGSAHYHEGYWTDSAAGRYSWLDVGGPVRGVYWFDLKKRQLVGHRDYSSFTGWGTLPNQAGRADTLPAGLRLTVVKQPLTADRARLLARALPGRDTTVTLDSTQHMLYLHSVMRSPGQIDGGMARADGWVHTAHANYADGKPVTFDGAWTDAPGGNVTTRHVERRGDSLLVRSDAREMMTPVPQVTWAIADVSMQEFLVPVLMAMPHDSVDHPLAVFRPYFRQWDVFRVRLWRAAGMDMALLTLGQGDAPVWLVMTPDGDLLLAERGGPAQYLRIPVRGSPRLALLQSVLKQGVPKQVQAVSAGPRIGAM